MSSSVGDTKLSKRDGSSSQSDCLISPEFNPTCKDFFSVNRRVQNVFAIIHVCDVSTIHLALAYDHSLSITVIHSERAYKKTR